MAWDDVKKQKAIDMYKDAEPTPETSVQIVKDIAEQIGETANGVRMILSKAEVYVKSAAPASSGTAATKDAKTTTPKVGKADKIEALSRAISSSGMVPDADILDKLTGKAADYFCGVITTLNKAASEKSE